MKHEFDGFTAALFLDDDGDWMAHLIELPNVSAFGPTPEETLRELRNAWEGMKESFEKHNEPIPCSIPEDRYTGSLLIHIDKQVHRALAEEASISGLNINSLVAQKLTNTIHR